MISKFISTIILALSFITGIAQYSSIESLTHDLWKPDDRIKVKRLRELTWNYVFSYPDTAILFGLKGLQLSKQINDTTGQILISFPLCEAFATKGNFVQALELGLQARQLS
jgi:hypothetical protein